MIRKKFICHFLLVCMIFKNGVLSQMVYPESDEDTNSYSSYGAKQGVKTVDVSSRMFPTHENDGMSGSQANAGSSSFNYGSGGFGASGSAAQANAGTMNYGGNSGSAASANSGTYNNPYYGGISGGSASASSNSMTYGQPSPYGPSQSGSLASAQSGSTNIGTNPAIYSVGVHCDPMTPNKEHPLKCSMFLQCERGVDGIYKFVEKNCGPGTMFNPTHMICDHPINVIAIRPGCGETSQSGASANAGTSSFGGNSLGMSGSSSQANSGTYNYNGYPGGGYPSYGASGSSASAQSGSSSLFQPGYSGNAASANANAGSLSYGGGGAGNSGGYGGSSASAGSSSYTMSIPCTGKPEAIDNSKVSCSSNGVCQISCLADHKFPNGESTMQYICNNGRWILKSFEYNEVPPCDPVCIPKCLNNGICISPGECECAADYTGPYCELKNEVCIAAPPLPAHASRSCSKSKCSLTCMQGYRFPDRTQTINLICKNGAWVPERVDILNVPDCEPICEPACLNGGSCLAYNVCRCPQNFRGPQCQYAVERCSPKKLNFNGGYNCTGSSDFISCKLYCPGGAKFTFPPDAAYKCFYAVAEFVPATVPKCIYGDGVIVQHQESEKFGQMTNGTWKKTPVRRNRTIETEEDEVVEETVRRVVKKKKNATIWVDEEEFFETPDVYQLYSLSQGAEVTYRTPKPSVCITWNGNKIKTFDGVTFSHELICSHVLVQDYKDGTFNVILRSCPYESVQPCPHALEVFLQNEQFTFENVGGEVKMFTTKKEIPIPVQIAGLKVTRSGFDVRIVLEAIPLTITWDTKKFVQIDALETVFNRTAGICGTMDAIMSNDFMSKDGVYHKMPSTFVDSWRTLNMDKNREKCIPRALPLTSKKCETAVEEKANLVCTDLLKNPKMRNCLSMFNQDALMASCISDYCDCKNTYERTECICNGISALAKDCRFRGVLLDDGWRDWQICPLNCTNGRVYKSCGPLNEPSCGSAIESDSFNCREGCFCPEGTMLSNGICVNQENCPCMLKGKALPPNRKITKDCNTCTCEGGNWKCTSLTCGARCGSVGDPHYVTFDGKRYDFMGKCSYYLMKTDAITVEAENVACSGAISESMNFLPSFSTEMPSCTKSLTIKFNDDAGQLRIIKLKQSRFVLLDGFEVAKLPWEISNGAVQIRQASSSFIVVDFQDGAKVWWDGSTRAYIDAPASYRGKTLGLCGTFNSNMQDDFLTPEGDIETTVHQFANKWQTQETCEYLTDKVVPHPCQVNVESKPKAEKICAKLLKDSVFEECHLFVDPEPFYEDCLYDMCACTGDITQCACPILAAYATECARQGTILNWRYQVAECAINCPNGQVWEQCGEACTRTCSDLQTTAPCKLQCVEGCRCPFGQVLDEENNECVMTSMCKCIYKGMDFKPGYKEVRPGIRHLELCTCMGGQWKCVEAMDGDSIKYPPATDMTKKCSPANNEVFTTCEPEPVTCKNMHLNIGSSPAICRAGCKCKDGYVLDVMLKKCVSPEKCSCHHGGKSYNDGDKIKEDCNTCLCRGGKWQCTVKECPGTCSLWGDNHFKTFDGREFDFQGLCSYMLSKGVLSDGEGYSVAIQNVLCGSNGVTCSKTLVINLLGNEPESITLSSDSVATPGIQSSLSNGKPLRKILTYRTGVFLVVEIPHIGVLLKWDRGTRVHLRLENRWKGKVQGLCGNYNYDALDDFLNPSLGIENNPIIFGHSWKLDDSCATPTEQVDSCTLNPQRKTWAQRKCGLLKSSEFSLCHSEVSVDSFYKRCIHDACSCDQGGDCECLCTALAAYAYACTEKGVNIRWRTPDLCPMQCDPQCSNYHPCIDACPTDTCDNLMHPLKQERLCQSEMCVEGCKLKECPSGMVYQNDSYIDCVPKATCKPICLQQNGITYYEDDIMSSDACHTCKCTRGTKSCTGVPCIPPAGGSVPSDLFACETGWTEWINQDKMDPLNSASSNYFKNNDLEPLPSSLQFKNIGGKILCKPELYAAIECRSVVTHQNPKTTGQDVECSLERGLVCNGQCFDYEIRIFCDCGDIQKTTPVPTTVAIPTVPFIPLAITPKYTIGEHCDPNAPNKEHPKDCSLFLQCERGIDGSYMFIEKPCGPGTMYNPKNMVCDMPFNVIPIRPFCDENMQGDKCPPGYEWSECAVPCKRSCDYYGKVLTLNGNCSISSNDCKEGCLPQGSAVNCAYPKLWRDHLSCVEMFDCTCMGPNNEQLKPGQKVITDDCKTCQCVNNEIICIDTVCQLQATPPPQVLITPTPPSGKVGPGGIFIPPSKLCDKSIPIKKHPDSCRKYLLCKEGPDGRFVYSEGTCPNQHLFNPYINKCDITGNVIVAVPSCDLRKTIHEESEEDLGYYETTAPNELYVVPTTLCDPKLQFTEHPKKCSKYLVCQKGEGDEFYYVEEACERGQMFNPLLKECDEKINVIKIKPKCRPKTIYVEEPDPDYVEMNPPPFLSLCDTSVEYKEHPSSCYKFLHCSPASNGSFVYVEKTCAPDMMYNPILKVCDWPGNVKKIKLICDEDPGEAEVWKRKVKVTTPTPFIPIAPIQPTEKPFYITECDPSAPIIEHPESCHKYLECLQAPNGNFIYKEQICNFNFMYHPMRKTCSPADEVEAIKSICRTAPIAPPSGNQITQRPPGIVTTRPPKKISPAPKITPTAMPPMVTKPTVTPPLHCDQSQMVPLLYYLPDTAFSASTYLNNKTRPEAARLDSRPFGETIGHWSPIQNDLNQYLQIEFPHPLPIYGIIVRGSPIFHQYVTSFKVLYSYYDGVFFHVIEDENGNPQIFSGSVDSNNPVKNIFSTPAEAKYVRIYPLSFHGSIALRAEILGCQRNPLQPPIDVPPHGITTPIMIPLTTPITSTIMPTVLITPPPSVYTIAPVTPLCVDPMGVENAQLSPSQITFSSIKDMGSVKTKVRKNPLEIIKLQSPRGWMPFADSLSEFVLFDFLENRNLTGVITKGGEYGWVKSFTVGYSKDDIIWNKILDPSTGKPKQFIANYDSESPKKNYFTNPINARYLKIQPSKWHAAIELKLEPLGCFLPYPIDYSSLFSPSPVDYDIITPTTCNICKGALPPRLTGHGSCACYPPLYWSGSDCVPQSDCPCTEGHNIFAVGEQYRTENCDECICKLGGIPECVPKVCQPCKKGLRRIAPGTCNCRCEKCPPEFILCETSGQCIHESSWCDEVVDCPDDEIHCGSAGVPTLHVNRTEEITITKKCPEPLCPPGFRIKQKTARKSKMSSRFDDSEDDDAPTVNSYYYIKAKYTASYEAILPISTKGDQQDINSEECIEFVCIPLVDSGETPPDYVEGFPPGVAIKCPEPKCPNGYMMRLQLIKTANECAKFTCEPVQDNDAVCNVTGRTFNTFDSTEFKYDICSHLLARDIADEKWNVIMRKNCSAGNNVCTKEIEIKDKVSLYTLILYPTLTVNLDGYSYTVQQLQNSNRKMSFVVSKNGDSLLYTSHAHGIWLTFDSYGDVKVGVSAQYVNQVDGLCGFFSNDKNDDKRTPTGEIASSTVEFGNSWSLNLMTPEECEPQVCPAQLQKAAIKMCNLVKEETFAVCSLAVNQEQFISACWETACECLLTATNGSTALNPLDLEQHIKQCKCAMLKNYVQDCMAADENVHLETWRSVYSCESSCPTPFVHQDCYRRKCEFTCNNLQTAECSNVPGTCFSGCFCPSGTVKKEGTCVPISECRDCVCDGFGKSQYLTYDRKNFTFDGNCTYLLTRDISLKDVHTFEVYATIGPCNNKTISFRQPTCTQAFHIAYGTHIVHIQKDASNNLEIIVDGLKLPSLSFNKDWMKITQQEKSLNILLPESQVELITLFEAMSFTIKVPSVKYGNKMEGICGNCNGNPDDDLVRNPSINHTLPLTNTEMQNFAISWLADEPKLSLNENKATCHIDEETDCLPLPPETDPCFKILDDEAFAKCHIIVDPIQYVTACQQDMCRTGATQKGSCESIAAYARECLRNGICIDWRRNGYCPMECGAPYVYDPCGCGETCQSAEEKAKQIELSTAIKDARTIEKMKSICKAGLSEGCFCPNGTVAHNGKCLREIECRACDDKGHLPGDVWHPDVCTKCTCGNDSTIQCQKIQCPTQTICGIGFVAIESSPTGECCKKYACVPEMKTTVECPELPLLPNCGIYQTNKIINDTSGCPKQICACIPKSQCPAMQNITTTLEPGMKEVIDKKGCCPVSKLVCDKSKCPSKPPQCTEAFHMMEKTQTASDKICCDIFECRPPPNKCIATINGKKILKNMDETWMTEDVCVKAQCAFDTNGNPIIKTQQETCNVVCKPGFELKPIPSKCCGECIKTKCIADNKLYEVGETWLSEDNCTTFECNIKDGQTLIASMMPTCPDISTCPPSNRYTDGCCEKCKLEALSQQNCLAQSLAETQTIGLIQIQMPPHGNCKNLDGIRGITQCEGSCKSGTRFNPATFHQVKECECCSVYQTREVPVELICDDGYKFIKNVDVPSTCACTACEGSEDTILKFARASF